MLHDLAGNPIAPTSQGATAGTSPRVLSVPLVRDEPNEQSVEFLYTGYRALAADTLAPTTLFGFTNSSGVFGEVIPPQFQARIRSIFIECPDMVAAAVPYLFLSLTINGAPVNAWGQIPIFPMDGLVKITFDDLNIDVAAGQTIGLTATNGDLVNSHFVGVYLHGWQYPKGMVQA